MRIDTNTIPAGPLDADPTLRKLLGELVNLTEQHAAAFTDRRAADDEQNTAAAADSALYAKALRAGDDDPGPVAQRAAEERIVNAQRRLDATEIAAGQVTDEISDRVRETAAKLRKHVDDATDKARAALGKGLDAVSAALGDHDRAQYVGRWITAVAGRQSSTPAADPDVRLIVTDLLGERRPFAWTGIEGALRDLTDPSRVARREAQPGSPTGQRPQMITEHELVHGRGTVPDEQPVS